MPTIDFSKFQKKEPIKVVEKGEISKLPVLRQTPDPLNFNIIPDKTVKYSNYIPTSDEIRNAYYSLTHKTIRKSNEEIFQEIIHNSIKLLRDLKTE